MIVAQAREIQIDVDRVAPAASPLALVRRRINGRYVVDPFGFDPDIADLASPVVSATVHIDVEGTEHIPASGPAAMIMNRGFGFVEPTAVSLAVRRAVGRRLRVVGLPGVPFVNGVALRFGAVSAEVGDVASALRAGHLLLLPLAQSWLRTGAGSSPLALLQAMRAYPVLPVAVRPSGPLGLPLRWSVRIGAPLETDRTYPIDDPLAAAELGENVRQNVEKLLGRSVT